MIRKRSLYLDGPCDLRVFGDFDEVLYRWDSGVFGQVAVSGAGSKVEARSCTVSASTSGVYGFSKPYYLQYTAASGFVQNRMEVYYPLKGPGYVCLFGLLNVAGLHSSVDLHVSLLLMDGAYRYRYTVWWNYYYGWCYMDGDVPCLLSQDRANEQFAVVPVLLIVDLEDFRLEEVYAVGRWTDASWSSREALEGRRGVGVWVNLSNVASTPAWMNLYHLEVAKKSA